jgi:zinc transport system ATP-binding protein
MRGRGNAWPPKIRQHGAARDGTPLAVQPSVANRHEASANMTSQVTEGSDAVLVVSGLTIRFGARAILRDLDFQVTRGTALAILGPNASGKTVLFRALIGALPYHGTITWAPGTRIGYVPQKLDLERDIPMTGMDFLRARAALLPGPTPSDAVIARTLDLVGVAEPVARQTIGTLSGGQFQRLLIAFALIGDPTVLLLDEPTAGIDEPGQEQLNQLVLRLQRERAMTVLFISHELSVVVRYATNVLCLGRDRACIGAPHAILTPQLLQEIYGAPVEFHVHAG